MNIGNSTCALVVFVAANATALAANPGTPTFESDVRPFLAKNCQMCHNGKLKTAEVNFEQFKTEESTEAAPELWEKAIEKLRQGAMPPAPLPHPKQAEVEAALKWMEGA